MWGWILNELQKAQGRFHLERAGSPTPHPCALCKQPQHAESWDGAYQNHPKTQGWSDHILIYLIIEHLDIFSNSSNYSSNYSIIEELLVGFREFSQPCQLLSSHVSRLGKLSSLLFAQQPLLAPTKASTVRPWRPTTWSFQRGLKTCAMRAIHFFIFFSKSLLINDHPTI